ncbi:MAG TPA: SRPBCC family protein [Tepidisphaeraceae bacterium]|nr:SRPBCC family protein [Tepidisphaeraceae bacterium]
MTIAETELSRSQSGPSTGPGRGDGGLQAQTFTPFINVGSTERLVSGGLGAALALWGLKNVTHLNLLRGALGAGVGAMLLKRAATGHCQMYQALGVNQAGDGAAPEQYFERGIHVVESFTVMKPASELYAFWRDFSNLAKFMKHVQVAKAVDDKHSHWKVDGPFGMSVEWDAEIINEEQDKLIAWRSLGGAMVDNAGSVRFVEAPGDRGTEVTVTLDYIPPAGRVSSYLAKLMGRDADQMIREDLRRFKRLMETGEVPTIEGQPIGNCGGSGDRKSVNF